MRTVTAKEAKRNTQSSQGSTVRVPATSAGTLYSLQLKYLYSLSLLSTANVAARAVSAI
jgi:hypothetical protein